MIKYNKKDHALEVDTPNTKLKLDQADLSSLRQALFDLPAHNSSELIVYVDESIFKDGK